MTRAYATDRFAISPRPRETGITPLGFRQFRLVEVEAAPGAIPTYVPMLLIR